MTYKLLHTVSILYVRFIICQNLQRNQRSRLSRKKCQIRSEILINGQPYKRTVVMFYFANGWWHRFTNTDLREETYTAPWTKQPQEKTGCKTKIREANNKNNKSVLWPYFVNPRETKRPNYKVTAFRWRCYFYRQAVTATSTLYFSSQFRTAVALRQQKMKIIFIKSEAYCVRTGEWYTVLVCACMCEITCLTTVLLK